MELSRIRRVFGSSVLTILAAGIAAGQTSAATTALLPTGSSADERPRGGELGAHAPTLIPIASVTADRPFETRESLVHDFGFDSNRAFSSGRSNGGVGVSLESVSQGAAGLRRQRHILAMTQIAGLAAASREPSRTPEAKVNSPAVLVERPAR